MEWDAYAKENEYYECYSLYLDSLDFAAYRAVINGELSRKKIRFRLYDLKDQMGFLEMKRKNNRVIIKDRELLSVENFQKFLCFLRLEPMDFYRRISEKNTKKKLSWRQNSQKKCHFGLKI